MSSSTKQSHNMPASAVPLWMTLAGFASICSFSMLLLSYAYLGIFSRYHSDDFQTAGYLRSLGFWANQKFWYLTWSGRFSFTFTIDLVQKYLGAHFVRLLPALILVAWTLALTWDLILISKPLKWKYPVWTSLLLSELMIAVLLIINKHPEDIVLWETGIITYTLPLVGLLICLGLLYRFANSDYEVSRWTLRCGGVVAFVLGGFLGGFSETFVAIQTTALVSALVVGKFTDDARVNRITPMLRMALLGSLLALAIVALAPGNETRMVALHAASPGMAYAFKAAPLYAFYLIYLFVFSTPLAAAITFIIPALLAYHISYPQERTPEQPRIDFKKSALFLLLNLLAFILIASSVVPAYFATSFSPPPRALLLAQAVIVTMTVCWGYLTGSAIKNLFRNSSNWLATTGSLAVVGVLLAIVPLGAAFSNFRNIQLARTYAEQWDAQDIKIRIAAQSGIKNLQVEVLPEGMNTGCQLSTNPQHWYNQAVAMYYGIESVSAPGSTEQSCN